MNIRGWILVVVILLGIIFAAVSYNRLASRLPHTITIASGSEAGAYHNLALQLKEVFRLEYPRITVEIQTTDGSADNLDRIMEGKVQFAFYQNNRRSQFGQAGGEKPGENDQAIREVRAVANLYVEVLHVVVRKGIGADGIQDLRGVDVSVVRYGERYDSDGTTGASALQYERERQADALAQLHRHAKGI